MAGKALAVASGSHLVGLVTDLANRLGLSSKTEVGVGRRIWGARRRIDVVLSNDSGIQIGIECKHQSVSGTAEEKIIATLADIDSWPIRGLVVFSGDGFSPNMRAYITSSGKAVDIDDLEDWLILYFGRIK